jgi:hypothetical protein
VEAWQEATMVGSVMLVQQIGGAGRVHLGPMLREEPGTRTGIATAVSCCVQRQSKIPEAIGIVIRQDAGSSNN